MLTRPPCWLRIFHHLLWLCAFWSWNGKTDNKDVDLAISIERDIPNNCICIKEDSTVDISEVGWFFLEFIKSFEPSWDSSNGALFGHPFDSILVLVVGVREDNCRRHLFGRIVTFAMENAPTKQPSTPEESLRELEEIVCALEDSVADVEWQLRETALKTKSIGDASVALSKSAEILVSHVGKQTTALNEVERHTGLFNFLFKALNRIATLFI